MGRGPPALHRASQAGRRVPLVGRATRRAPEAAGETGGAFRPLLLGGEPYAWLEGRRQQVLVRQRYAREIGLPRVQRASRPPAPGGLRRGPAACVGEPGHIPVHRDRAASGVGDGGAHARPGSQPVSWWTTPRTRGSTSAPPTRGTRLCTSPNEAMLHARTADLPGVVHRPMLAWHADPPTKIN